MRLVSIPVKVFLSETRSVTLIHAIVSIVPLSILETPNAIQTAPALTVHLSVLEIPNAIQTAPALTVHLSVLETPNAIQTAPALIVPLSVLETPNAIQTAPVKIPQILAQKYNPETPNVRTELATIVQIVMPLVRALTILVSFAPPKLSVMATKIVCPIVLLLRRKIMKVTTCVRMMVFALMMTGAMNVIGCLDRMIPSVIPRQEFALELISVALVIL